MLSLTRPPDRITDATSMFSASRSLTWMALAAPQGGKATTFEKHLSFRKDAALAARKHATLGSCLLTLKRMASPAHFEWSPSAPWKPLVWRMKGVFAPLPAQETGTQRGIVLDTECLVTQGARVTQQVGPWDEVEEDVGGAYSSEKLYWQGEVQPYLLQVPR